MQIKIENLKKSFNYKTLFDNISATLNSGESWAVLGPNGTGKSTFLLMLAGQVLQDKGNMEWSNENKKYQIDEVYSLYSLASPAQELIEEYTIQELYDLHFQLKPKYTNHVYKDTIELCKFSKVTEKTPIGNFSSGMKQRIKLCLAFLTNTPLLLLDEPLTNLDADGVLLYQELLKKYKNNRLTVVASNREDEYYFCENKLLLA